MAHADAITLIRRGREERLFLTTFSFGHFANDWTAGSILLLTPAIAVGMDLTPAQDGLQAGERVSRMPSVSVADARATEETDATLAFVVTLSRAATGIVTLNSRIRSRGSLVRSIFKRWAMSRYISSPRKPMRRCVTRYQGGNEDLLDIGKEGDPIHRPVQEHRRGQAIPA